MTDYLLPGRGISFILDFDKEVTPEVVKKEQDKLEKVGLFR